ncbi:hypothetical protein D3C71_1934470 [compost metagenome]
MQLRLVGLLGGCAEGSRQCADAPATHILLGGLFAQFATLRQELDAAFANGPPEWAMLWQRDQSVLEIAGAARGKRLAKAWQTLGL